MSHDIKEKLLRFYKGTEGEDAAVRMIDLASQALKTQKYKLTGFLTPYEQEIAGAIANSLGSLKLAFNGGFEGAERQRVAICHEDFPGTPDFEIAVLDAKWNAEFVRLSHRDVLGSLMSLGLERYCIGDIIATKEMARILVDKKVADYFIANLTHIGEARVEVSLGDLSSIAPKEERIKDIRATVASLRIDSIAAAGFGMSRTKAADEIKAEKIKLNWQTAKNASQSIKQGDILSMRGRGRLEIVEIRCKTKKGRTAVLLRRFL